MTPSVIHRADGKFHFPDGAVLLSLVSFAILLASLVIPAEGLPGIDTCAFHALTGLSCPGCGLTRAFCAISHGQIPDAWSLNPFSFPLYLGALVGSAAPLLNRRFPALSGEKAAKAFRVGILMLATGMLIYGGWRAMGQIEGPRGQSKSGMLPAGSP